MLLSLATCSACTAEAPIDPETTDLFDVDLTTIVLEVDYAEGAEPAVGALGPFDDLWDVFETNASELFGGSRTVRAPHELADMELLHLETGAAWTADDLMDLAHLHRQQADTSDTATFYAVWLDGWYADGSGVREDVLGVDVAGTRVLAVFAPALAPGGPLDSVRASREPDVELVSQPPLVRPQGPRNLT